MQINLAHLHIQGIDVAVFDANARNDTDRDRAALLASLTAKAQASRLRVQKSALAYVHHGSLRYYGTPDLVQFLANNGLPRWTHTVSL